MNKIITHMDKVYYLREKLKNLLTEHRYEHSLSVSFTAVCLAMRYGEDIKKAEIAGLLHDIAKQFKDEDLILDCKKVGIELSDDLIKAPWLIHGIYGAYYIENFLDIHDMDILNAVRNHTMGRPDMSGLEKIIFISDYIEARRDRAPDLQYLRKEAFIDMDKCICEILDATFIYLENTGGHVSSKSMETYNYYKRRFNE